MGNTQVILRLAVLSLWMSPCATRHTPCQWYPSPDFIDVSMKCSGVKLKYVPRWLSGSLKTLRLSETAIQFLDNTSFQGRNLSGLKSLFITGGVLSRVEANAFCPLDSLTMLRLDGNLLNLVHERSFSCNKNLINVSLADNPIRRLPRLASGSVESLYLDNCSLESIDVAAVAGMTALRNLFVRDNPDLDCASEKARFKHARPNLQVICGASALDMPPRVSTSGKSLGESDSASENTEKQSTAVEERTSETSPTRADLTVENTQNVTTAGDERTLEKSLSESDSASNNTRKASNENATITVSIIAGISFIVIICLFYLKYRRVAEITASYQGVSQTDP